jgi:glutathione S-transferase
VILIGQYDSPFVRRVAIALRLYDLPFEHRPWSVFGDAERIAPYNPLLRVPVLVLDSDDALIESAIILDYLDELAGPAGALVPREGGQRRQALRICALATGLGDKAVSLVYERLLHQERSQLWEQRCRGQIGAVLDHLEADRGRRSGDFWFGSHIGHADIAVACVLRFVGEAHPDILAADRWPALAAHAARCEALPPFRDIVQPLILPR